MKRIIIFSGIILLLLAGCGQKDKKSQLEEYRKQREELDAKIAALEKEIGNEGQNGSKKFAVETIQAKPKIFRHYIEIQGTVESDNNIIVSSESMGMVTKVSVSTGQRVKAGTLLAKLDGSALEKQINSMKPQLELAKTNFERQKRLWDQKIGSEMQYLQAKSNLEALEQQYEALKEQYAKTRIISPISGTVDEVMLKQGENAAPGMPAFRVVQLSDLKIKAALSERYVPHIKVKDSVKIEIPVIEKEFWQTIRMVSQVIDPNNRTFDIELRIPASQKDIKPNMVAVLHVLDYENPNAFIVPEKAIQKSENGDFVFIAKKHNNQWIAEKRIVKSGKTYNDMAEVKSGLEEGDSVIVFGYNNLADGQPIIISEKK